MAFNIVNKAPNEGISLVELLPIKQCGLHEWAAESLLAFESAISFLSKPLWVCDEIEKRFWSRKILLKGDKDVWNIKGLEIDGALRIQKGELIKSLRRSY